MSLAWTGLDLIKDNDDRTKYALLKNLGWARLMQQRYPEALEQLEMARTLDSQIASAYCLKAQALEGLGDGKGAQVQWQSCILLARKQDPDQDIWVGMAKQRLKTSNIAPSTWVR